MASDERIAKLTVAPGVKLGPIDLSVKSGVNLKGFSLQALCEVVSERFGAAFVDAWKQKADVDLRAVTATTWFPLEYYYHLIEHCVAVQYGGDASRAVELGVLTAKREINAFFRFVLAFTTPSMVLGLSARFWRSYYDKTDLVIVETKGDSLRAEIRGWPLMNAAAAYEVSGAMFAWLESSRAKNVRLTKLEFTAPGLLSLHASW
jgi:hypothetical protein